VSVAADDAATLLAMVIERAPVPSRPVAQLIADFDAGREVDAEADADTDEETTAWELEDVF
jgi:hypothetical protein